MANLPESAAYDAGIYQIELVDAVIGGVNGISNLQAKGLANRTTWLKAQVDALNALKGTGTAAFSAGSSYSGGQQVIYQKNIWQANTSISPGAFNPANWTRQLGVAAESSLADAVPLMDGVAAVGTSTDVAREDHVHPTDTSRAALGTTVQKDSNTGAAELPVGTIVQRPSNGAGKLRYNSDTSRFEGNNGAAWGSLGGATGGGTDAVFYLNDQTINNDYTVTGTQNAMTAGPITIASGKTVTVASGAVWTVV
jgi:hypothetical protein